MTLQFDTAQQRETGLIAIENGAFDARLRQWANSVREYASPLVVTVLPQADADWAVSSAVAGGGVPADASAAWRHVRDLFAKAGASNAAFAWAPARAGDDEQFAPPKGSTDAVVVTELRLNGTAWPNVSSALDLAAEAHPGAPLILVLGAVGDSVQKATWLRDALAQAAARPRVEAVVYHEAAPGSSGDDPAEDWSASSDPATTKVMQAFLRTAADGDVTRKAVLNAAESAR
ncbi:hypothetical protein [Curtobacterium sp. PhB130]|uniref:hypothetical protein n=1 Tax=Curtobacterium sp. PhB130 TaxID=2485178 RepID=UPI0011CD6A41|nr:hypothetical protein [Curtobacterium sp. PhB130]